MAIVLADKNNRPKYIFPSVDTFTGRWDNWAKLGCVGGLEALDERFEVDATTSNRVYGHGGMVTGDGKGLPKTIVLSGVLSNPAQATTPNRTSQQFLREALGEMSRNLNNIGYISNWARLYLTQNIEEYPASWKSETKGWYYSLDGASLAYFNYVWLSPHGVEIEIGITLGDPLKYYSNTFYSGQFFKDDMTYSSGAWRYTVNTALGWPVLDSWGGAGHAPSTKPEDQEITPESIRIIPECLYFWSYSNNTSMVQWGNGNDYWWKKIKYDGDLDYGDRLILWPHLGTARRTGDQNIDQSQKMSGTYFSFGREANEFWIKVNQQYPTTKSFATAFWWRPATM